MVKLLVTRELKQAETAKRQDDNAPSKELRLSAMGVLRAKFAETLTAQTNGRAAGATRGANKKCCGFC